MPIIFGWGRQTIKQIGVVFKQACGHCHNEEYWVLTKITTWFTLFFIPIIPYSIKYFLSCPVCKYGLTLDDKQVNELRPLAEVNQLLIEGKITPEEYKYQISQLNGGSTETKEIKEAEIVSDTNNLMYCSNCGSSITKDLKFCGNCGSKT